MNVSVSLFNLLKDYFMNTINDLEQLKVDGPNPVMVPGTRYNTN